MIYMMVTNQYWASVRYAATCTHMICKDRCRLCNAKRCRDIRWKLIHLGGFDTTNGNLIYKEVNG